MTIHAQQQRTFGMTMIRGEMDEQGIIRRKGTHPLGSLPLRVW